MKGNSKREYSNDKSERRIRNNRNRRRRERRKNICLFILTLAFIISCFFTVGSILTNAQSSHKTITHKVYRSITVSAGDNLSKIAKEHLANEYDDIQAYVEEVMQINHMEDDEITSGMYLVVPHYIVEEI